MKGFLSRLFGGAGEQETEPEVALQPAVPTILQIKHFDHGLVRIPALDYFGPHAQSPGGRFHLLWLDRDPNGSIGGHRYEGHGVWTLIDGTQVIATGRLERPQDGHVGDNGNFVLADWMFGDGLNGRLAAFDATGAPLIERMFSANIVNTGLSADGTVAICLTANAPGSQDSCRYFLFDLADGREFASWEPETGWADSYEFDTRNRTVFLQRNDGERVGYSFEGEMLDRKVWQDRRILAGDLDVIRAVFGAGDLEPVILETLFRGLDVAVSNGEDWSQARALRLCGEIHEQAGDIAAAIAAYDKALTIDPQVGVARRLAHLQRAQRPKGEKPSVPRMSRFEQQANRLGVEHEKVWLEKGDVKAWRSGSAEPWTSMEEAVLDHYRSDGWNGAASEGGLILTLIKAASFAKLQVRHADTFIEALYAQNVAFDEDRFTKGELIALVSRATRTQVERNWEIIAASTGISPTYYPAVRRDHVTGLFEVLGTDRLAAIAEAFSTAPYDFRAGWPDLTLWRDGAVRFVEVKAPGDSFHTSQARLISKLLLPLGFSVSLAEVRPKP